MGQAWEVVFRAQRLSPALNSSTSIDEMRERLSELIGSAIDKSSTVFVQLDYQTTEKTEVRSPSRTENDYIFLKVGHRIQKIAVGDILFVEGMKDYLKIHTVKEKIMALMSFAKLEELLPRKTSSACTGLSW